MDAADHHANAWRLTGRAARAAALSALLIAAALLALQSGDRAVASEFLLTTTNDTVDAIPGDGICADADGLCSLRGAVLEANAHTGPDVITVPPLAFGFTLNRAGANENNGSTGDLDLTGQLTIEGSAPGIVIDANEIDRVFHVRGGAQVAIRNLRIENGDAGAGDGGGVFNEGTLTLDGVALRHHMADDGGAIANYGTLTVTDSLVAESAASDVGGGIHSTGPLAVTRTTIDGNSGPFGGGGINNLGSLVMESSTLSWNSATSGRGGGLNNIGSATVTNSTFSHNDSFFSAGGIANAGAGMVLTNVTIAENVANAPGGGIYNNAVESLVLRNTLLATNVGGNCAFDQPLASSSHTMETGPTCGFAGPGDVNAVDAQLGPLADNGGPAFTHAPGASSPAIDAGTNDGCPAHDQRGAARPADGDANGSAICDIGAYERLPDNATPAPPTSTPSVPTPTGVPALPGDVDCNGMVNSVDAVLILQYAAGRLPSFACPNAADVSGNGRIDAVDAALILQYVAGLIDSLPP